MPTPSDLPPEQHRRIVDAALSKIPNLAAPPPNEGQVIMDRAMSATKRIMSEVRPLIEARGFIDRKTDGLKIGERFLEEFMSWSKDDLVYLCATIHTDFIIERSR